MNLTFMVTAKEIDENMGEVLNKGFINMIKDLAMGFRDGDIACNKNSDASVTVKLSVKRNGELSTQHMDVTIF